jgi:hypothetical protein
MVTLVLAATGEVVTVNLALVLLPPMLTLVGTPAADGLLLLSATVAPPGGAAPMR